MGGTSLHKVVLDKPARYSEDIDLVYTAAQPIGPVLDGIRTHLDPWLGKPKRKFKDMLVTLTYRFQAETGAPMRLKIEINQREKKNLHGFVEHHFEMNSPWFRGAADIRTYSSSTATSRSPSPFPKRSTPMVTTGCQSRPGATSRS